MIQTNPGLQAKPDKESVILLMPFFAENSHLRSASSGQQQPLAAHQRPSLFGSRRRNNQTGGATNDTQLAI